MLHVVLGSQLSEGHGGIDDALFETPEFGMDREQALGGGDNSLGSVEQALQVLEMSLQFPGSLLELDSVLSGLSELTGEWSFGAIGVGHAAQFCDIDAGFSFETGQLLRGFFKAAIRGIKRASQFSFDADQASLSEGGEFSTEGDDESSECGDGSFGRVVGDMQLDDFGTAEFGAVRGGDRDLGAEVFDELVVGPIRAAIGRRRIQVCESGANDSSTADDGAHRFLKGPHVVERGEASCASTVSDQFVSHDQLLSRVPLFGGQHREGTGDHTTGETADGDDPPVTARERRYDLDRRRSGHSEVSRSELECTARRGNRVASSPGVGFRKELRDGFARIVAIVRECEIGSAIGRRIVVFCLVGRVCQKEFRQGTGTGEGEAKKRQRERCG